MKKFGIFSNLKNSRICHIWGQSDRPLLCQNLTPLISTQVNLVRQVDTDQTLTLTRLDHLDNVLTDLLTNLTLTTSSDKAAVHTESGTVACGDSNGWKIHEKYAVFWPAHYTLHRQEFAREYKSPPQVHVTVSGIDTDRQQYARIDVTVVSVDVQGFQIKCETWGGPGGTGNSHVYNADVSWISIG